MKTYLLILFMLISFSAFTQPGSQKISGLFLRVLDSAAYQSAAASSHSASPAGYADIYWNAQATTPHYDIWNGSSYDHVFDFGGGGGGTVTSVSGTSNRITSTGGTTPVIDISASYVGQASITTIGTLSSGTVPGTLVSNTPAGSIAATTGQAAINELDTEKLAATATTIGAQDLYIGSVAMWPRVTNGCASLAQTEMSTSLFNVQSLDFDQTTQEFAQMQFVMPRNWNNGTVTATVYWTAESGSGGVVWGISGGAYSNDDALTVALGTAQTVSDTFITANDLHITSTSSAITLAGTPADADFIAIQISRNPADGSDTLNADAKLLGIRLVFTLDAGTSE